MYLDYLLFIVGGVFLAAALGLLLYLLWSQQRSKDYQRILREETERLDMVSTLKNTQALDNKLKTTRAEKLRELSEQVKKTKKLLETYEMASDIEMLRVMLPTKENEEPTTLLEQHLKYEEMLSDIEQLRRKLSLDNTEILTEPLRTERLFEENRNSPALPSFVEDGLDLSAVEGKYELLKEIHGGGMSRVFLARHKTLGNEWIVKFVGQAELISEAEVLKHLNHISLPQIIDIFQTEQGAFLVERYIEGYSLADILELNQEIRESQICDWGLQLAQVLHYLHNLERPIIHCDLKPSNIMVTYDNRLVLIDFGISKQQGVSDGGTGITYRYAAPEQFRGKAERPEIIQKYFGTLPPEHSCWPIDCRTDLYSVGAILKEMASGLKGTAQVSSELSKIIAKCLEIYPEKRFSSAKSLAEALESMKNRQISIAKSLLLRQVMSVCCGLCLAGGMVTSASAVYVNRMENLSVVSMDPGQAVVSVQQSVQLLIQKTAPSGKETFLDPQKIEWSYSSENIARVDGDQLVGMNVGETTLYGQYRNKLIELAVTVTEPPEETTTVALRYSEENSVFVYAGTGDRDFVDGDLQYAAFVSPESVEATDGKFYLTDSGTVRLVENGVVKTVPLELEHLTAERVRVWNGTPYILTGPWEAEDGLWYGFARIGETGTDVLYQEDGAWTTVSDFAFSSDGTLWFIQQTLAFGDTALNRLDVKTGEAVRVMELPEGARYMAFDRADNLYVSVPEKGVILRIGAGASEWTYFAGVEGKRHFVDGPIPNFYRPMALAAEGNALYVLDFDTIRKITVMDAGALFTETLAGFPVADTNPKVQLGSGAKTVLPASERAALVVANGRILLSDPKNSAIYEIVPVR